MTIRVYSNNAAKMMPNSTKGRPEMDFPRHFAYKNVQMSANLFYFFECYTVLSTKLRWTKTTSYTSILGTYYPFFLFCISIFFVLPNNFIVLGFVILAYINFYFEHQSIINSIDVNMNMRNYCYLLFNNILDIILNI